MATSLNFDDLAEKKEQLVRKPLDGSCFRSSLSVAHIDDTTLFNPDGSLKQLATGYNDLGLLNQDGMAFSRNVNTSDVMAFGRQTPVRSDVTSDSSTLAVTAIETNLTTIELGTGATLSPGSRSAVNGSLTIKKPPRPTPKQYHFLSIAVDLTEDGEIYICRYFPKGKITAYGDQAFGGTDNPIGWNVTITSQFDSEYGASETWFFGGPGWNALLADMGFTAFTPVP